MPNDRVLWVSGALLVFSGLVTYQLYLDVVTVVAVPLGAILFLAGVFWRPNHDKMVAGGTLFLILGVLSGVAGATQDPALSSNNLGLVAKVGGVVLVLAGVEMVFDPLDWLP